MFRQTVGPGDTEPAADPPAHDAGLPETIGRYTVLGRIGSGGMGVIYSAYDQSLGRRVAVKLLNPRESRRGSMGGARLLREAQALARLSHPSVIQVYEVGTIDGQVFMAMEFVAGTTLRHWQSHAERSWRQVLAAYAAAGRGLAAAHRAGIVHRDFKPDNVLVSRDDSVRVIDFGLARTEAGGDTGESALEAIRDERPDVPLTRTGTLMGTPAYMAPEQFKGESADPRTDQFAFSVALFEALYGFRPFPGETVQTLAHNVLEGRVEPPPRYTDVPDRVRRTLARGLQADPAKRYPDLSTLLAELPAKASGALAKIVVAVAFAVVLAVVTLVVSLGDQGQAAQKADAVRTQFDRARIAAAESALRSARQRSQVDRYNDVVLARAEAAVADDPTQAVAILRSLDPNGAGYLGAARLIAASAADREVLVSVYTPDVGPVRRISASNDGSTVAIVGAAQGVRVWQREPLLELELRDLGEAITDVAVAGDGLTVVAAARDGRTGAWRGPGYQFEALKAHRGGATAVAVSSTGNRIATGGADGVVRVWERGSTTPREDRNHRERVRSIALSPDGAMLASAADDGTARMWFLEERVRLNLPRRPSAGTVQLAFGDGGRLLDCLGKDGRVWRLQTEERRGEVLDGVEGARLLARSAGSPVLAVAGAGPPLQLYLDAARPPRELNLGPATALAVSGDGRFVFAAQPGGTIKQWRVQPPERPKIGFHDEAVTAVALAPSVRTGGRAGAGIVAVGTSLGAVHLWPDGGETEALGHLLGGVAQLDFSPEGNYLAAVAGVDGVTVWRVASDGEGPRTVASVAGVKPPIRWSPDGSALGAQQCDTVRRCAGVVQAIDDQARRLTTTVGAPLRSLAISPGGTQVVLVRASRRDQLLHYRLDPEGGLPQIREPAWPGKTPRRVLAHVFVDGNALRLATVSDRELGVWHWDPFTPVLSVLERRADVDVLGDAHQHALLVRSSHGNDLWFLDQSAAIALRGVPRGATSFAVSKDRQRLLVVTSEAPAIIDIATGVARSFADVDGPVAWHGGFDLAAIQRYTTVRYYPDPTPGDPSAFFVWLAQLSQAPAKVAIPGR